MVALLEIRLGGRGRHTVGVVHQQPGDRDEREPLVGVLGRADDDLPADAGAEAVGVQQVLERQALGRAVLGVAAEGVELGVGRRAALAHQRGEQRHAAPRRRGDLAREDGLGQPPEARDRLAVGAHQVARDDEVLDPVSGGRDETAHGRIDALESS